MANLVSPCCGAEYNDDHIPVSSCCTSVAAPETDICAECYEHADFYTYACDQCDEVFEEPEVIYEYHARRKEAMTEAQEDERRDLGE